MATRTLGTAATNTLTALTYISGMNATDLATMRAGIKNDQINGSPIFPGAFTQDGLLHVPNRGVLRLVPGDVVAFNAATGWPIMLSAAAAASANWVYT